MQVSWGAPAGENYSALSLGNTTLWTVWSATSGAKLEFAALTGLLSNTGPSGCIENESNACIHTLLPC